MIFEVVGFQIPLAPFAKGGIGMGGFSKVGITWISFPNVRQLKSLFEKEGFREI